MARVPTDNQPIQSKPVEPGYESSAGATSAAFGGLQAASLEQAGPKLDAFGDKLGQEAIQQSEKRNAVARARDLGIFQNQAEDALRKVSTEQDMTDPNTLKGFQGQLDKLRDDTLTAHGSANGSDSASMLGARVEAARAGLLGHASGLADTAQTQLVGDTLKKTLQPITKAAYDNPGTIKDLMARSDAAVADMAPALGTVAAGRATNAGRQEILKSSIQSLLDTGQHDAASKLVSEYGDLLSPDNQRVIQQHITIGQVAAERARNATSALVANATAVLGRAPTDAERRVLIGLAKPEDPNSRGADAKPTPSETIAAFEKASGRPATDEEKAIAFGLAKPTVSRAEKVYAPTPTESIDAFEKALGRPATPEEKATFFGVRKSEDPNKQGPQYARTPEEAIKAFEDATGQKATDEQKQVFFGLAKPAVVGSGTGADFGKSSYGRSMAILNDGADAFAHNLMTPDEERKFQFATTIAQQPFQKLNPDTQVLETVTRPLPPQVVEAFNRRGIPLPVASGPTLATQGGPANGATPQPAPGGGSPAPSDGTQPAAKSGGVAGTGVPTFWDLNKQNLVTGSTATAAEFAHRIPGIGQYLPGQEMTSARHYVELQEHQFLTALANNKRYPVAEMKGIEKDLAVGPHAFDNAEAYGNRLFGLDDALATREAFAAKQANNFTSANKDDRENARRVLNLIQNFREELGAPRRMSFAEAKALPSGTQFRDPDTGALRTRK